MPLRPAPERAFAAELAELAWLAAPGDSAVARVRQRVFSVRADAAPSTMAQGIFRWAAQEAQQEAQ
jgi:hypothetical protein